MISFTAKDRSEKAFAVSYIELMRKDGTVISDGTHDLLQYKVIQNSPPLILNLLSLTIKVCAQAIRYICLKEMKEKSWGARYTWAQKRKCSFHLTRKKNI